MRDMNARDSALRALAEGAQPTLELLSDVSGRSYERLRAIAQREGWALDRFAADEIGNRIRAVSEPLLTHVVALGRKALEEGGRVEKGEIDAIIAIIRSLEKIGEIMRPGADAPAAKENQIRQDEDMAVTLDRINGRMVELARELAAQMVAEECRAGRCLARRWGVAR